MIEKNIRLQPHHSRDLLVGRRSDGKRPKYQPPGYGSSSARDSGSRGGGGPPGGGDRQMTYSAPSPAPDRQDRARQQAAVEQAAAKQRADEQRAEADRQEANRPNQLAEARKLMTQPTTVDVSIKGPELIPGTTGPVTLDPYQQNYISPGQVRTTGIYNEGDYDKLVEAPIDVGFQEALRKQQIATDLRQKQQDLAYGQFFRQPPVVEQPKFFDTGVGKFVKGVGKVVAQPFIPEPIQRALAGIGTARAGAKFAKAVTGKNIPQIPSNEELIRSAFTKSNVKSTIEKARGRQFDPKDPIGWTGEKKRTKTFHEPRDGDRQQTTTIQEAVAGEQPLGINLEDIRKKQMIMKTALDEGYYTDNEGRRIQLTDQHKKMLTNYITQIDQYLVDPRAMSAYGGRIDKALGGRSRDIG